MCSNYKGRRGTCEGTHYVRADSLEQIVMLELRSLASFLVEDEEAFADILEAKINKLYIEQVCSFPCVHTYTCTHVRRETP